MTSWVGDLFTRLDFSLEGGDTQTNKDRHPVTFMAETIAAAP